MEGIWMGKRALFPSPLSGERDGEEDYREGMMCVAMSVSPAVHTYCTAGNEI